MYLHLAHYAGIIRSDEDLELFTSVLSTFAAIQNPSRQEQEVLYHLRRGIEAYESYAAAPKETR